MNVLVLKKIKDCPPLSKWGGKRIVVVQSATIKRGIATLTLEQSLLSDCLPSYMGNTVKPTSDCAIVGSALIKNHYEVCVLWNDGVWGLQTQSLTAIKVGLVSLLKDISKSKSHGKQHQINRDDCNSNH